MKKFFGKIKELILNHKLLALICLLATILLVVLLAMVLLMTVSTSNNYKFEEFELSQKALNKKEEKIEEYEEVSEAVVRSKGKSIYYTIHYNHGTDKEKAKEIANSTITDFDDDEKKIYDLQYFLVENKADNEEEEIKTFTITGSKHNSKEEITWAEAKN